MVTYRRPCRVAGCCRSLLRRSNFKCRVSPPHSLIAPFNLSSCRPQSSCNSCFNSVWQRSRSQSFALRAPSVGPFQWGSILRLVPARFTGGRSRFSPPLRGFGASNSRSSELKLTLKRGLFSSPSSTISMGTICPAHARFWLFGKRLAIELVRPFSPPCVGRGERCALVRGSAIKTEASDLNARSLSSGFPLRPIHVPASSARLKAVEAGSEDKVGLS